MGIPAQDLGNVSEDAKALLNLMQSTLDRVLSVYESFSMPIPDRYYWTLGDPAIDCEQLVVTFIQMYVGPPGLQATQATRCNDPRSATINIRVSRQVPVVGQNGRPPTAEVIQSFSELVACDAWVLMESVKDLDAWGPGDPFGLGVVAVVDITAPEGGYQTTMLTITTVVP